MRFERRHAVLLLAVAAWTVLSFGNFALNLYDAWSTGEDRATSYWVAHTVLIVVNLVIAALLGTLGWRAWRATRPGAGGGPGRESARSAYGGGPGAAD